MRVVSKLAVAGAMLLAQPASAAWLEASSDHFIIYSDTKPDQLRQFATRLERYNSALRYLFMPKAKVDEGRRSNRLRIYVLPNVAAVQTLCGGCPNVMGFYVPRAGGSVVYTPRRSGMGSRYDLDAETVLFHEYAHHFMYANFTAAYPAWYSEGFAEFNSTARFEQNGGLGMGAPAMHRAYELVTVDVPIETLLQAGADTKSAATAQAVYSRGWLLTHYLTFNKARHGQLDAYVSALNSGTPSLAAAKAAFGDLAQLQKELDRYEASRRMTYAVLPAASTPASPVAIRELSAGAAAMMPIHMRSTRGVDREEALKILPEARRVGAAYPDDAVAQAQLAEAELDAGYVAEADAAADRALRADPASVQALIYKGMIQLERARETKDDDPAAFRTARSWFLKANKVDPNLAQPLYLFYDSFLVSGVKPTANAVLGLHRAFQLAPEDRNIRMRVAFQALNDKDGKLARRALAPIAFDPHGRGGSARAAEIVKLIDAGKVEDAGNLLHGDEDEAE